MKPPIFPSLPWPTQGMAVTSAPTANQCPPSVAATLSFHKQLVGRGGGGQRREREEDASAE